MGIENREYLRDEYDSASPFRRPSARPMTVILVVVTVAVFVLQLLTSRGAASSLAQNWLSLDFGHVVFQGQIWRLLTYAFCHDQSNLLHIVFNMMVLYSIGGVLRQVIGDREFLWFYLVAAVFAGICSLVFYRLLNISAEIIGASGATMAVFCLVAMHYPRQKVLLMGVIPIEMRWLLACFVAFDTLPILMGGAGSSKVAHAAHLGGLLFGFLYVRSHMNLTRWWDRFAGRIAMNRRNKGKLKLFAPPAGGESNLDAQMDPILEKISREGEASLTARERNILIQASRKLKKDRN